MAPKRLTLFLAKTQLSNPDKVVELWYQDESRFGQRGYLTHRWQKKGIRTEALKQQEFESTYFYGAINPLTGERHSLLFPTCDSYCTSLFLNSLSESVSSDKLIVLIMDQAGWHKSQDLKIPENIKLFYLPPYSPQLNPIERLWQHIKKKYLSNRYFENYQEILEAGCDAWNSLTREVVKSISSGFLVIARGCRHLSQITDATRNTADRKLTSSLS